MTHRHSALSALACVVAIAGIYVVAPNAATPACPLRLGSSRISIAGTSNIHAYTASTTAARIVRLEFARAVSGANVLEDIFKPGAIEAFEMAIPAATLSSPKEGLDKNMHKALKVTEYPDITFRLSKLEATGSSGAARGVGILTVAGVEREITLDLKTQWNDGSVSVSGDVQLLMTDFGIAPPKAMLGMLKTDPQVTVTFETVFAIPLT